MSRFAVLVQKSKNVVGPDGASEIAKGMAILHGVPKGWIDLDFEFLAGILHGVRKNPARGKVVIILRLKEKDGSAGMANAASHQRLKFGRLRPALGTACRIDRRAIGT